MATLGRYITVHDTDTGVCGAGGTGSTNERASIFYNSQNGWLYQMGLWCGEGNPGLAPTVYLGVWNVSGNSPTSRLGYTNGITASTLMQDATGGSAITGNIAHVTPSGSPGTNAVKINANTNYALGFLSVGQQLDHGMSAAANFLNGQGGYTQNVYMPRGDVSASATAPTDPFTVTVSDIQGVISVWGVYSPDVAPTTAIVAPTGSITSTTPTMQASFASANATYGDKLYSYNIQVRRKSDQVSFWNLQGDLSSSSEQSNNQLSAPYQGTALVAGTTYQWRAQVANWFGTTSSWTSWTDFTPTSAGTVTATTPNTKQLVNTGITFTGEWTHASSLNMKAAQIQLLQNGTVVQGPTTVTGYSVVSSAAPGTSFTVSWGQSAFATLAWGTAYTWQLQGQDTNNVWSSWSNASAFTTDAYPNAPTGLSPASGLTVTNLPILTCTMTDPDDTASGSLTCSAFPSGAPVLVNAGLASDANGWASSNTGDNAGATVALTQDVTVYGGGGFKAAISASTAAAGIVDHVENTATWIPVVVGESYTVRNTHRTDTANLHPLLQIRWYNSSLTLLSASTETDWSPATNTDYLRSFTAVAPASAAYARVGLALNTAAGNVTGNAFAKGDWSVDSGIRFSRAMAYNAGPATWTYQTVAGTNDVFTISVSGGPTGGSFTVNVDGALATIQWNSTAAAAQTALQALSTVGANLTVTGGALPGTPLTCTWNTNYNGTLKNVPTIGTNSLTGGSSPTPSVAHTTPGVPGDVAAYQTYGWTASGNDGTLQGARAAVASFVYLSGPTVTVSSPAAGATLTTNTPVVNWSTVFTGGATQQKYRVAIYAHGTSTVIYDTGTVTASAVTGVTVPSGYLHGSPATSYDVVVSITDTNSLVGSNAAQQFTVGFTGPAMLTNFQAAPALAGLDQLASSVLASWNTTTYSQAQFVDYLLKRRLAGTAAGDPSELLLARLTSLNATSFVDYLPVSGVSYTYALTQEVTQGTDVTLSAEATSTTSVALIGAVVCAATNGGVYRAVLSYVTDREPDHQQAFQVLMPWGATQPTILVGPQDYQVVAVKASIVTDATASAANYVAALRAMRSQRLTVCFRDERGRKVFGLITKFVERDARLNIYNVELEITETAFSEGAQ